MMRDESEFCRQIQFHGENVADLLAELAHRPSEERAAFALMAIEDAKATIYALVTLMARGAP